MTAPQRTQPCREEDMIFDPAEGRYREWATCTKVGPHDEHEDATNGHKWGGA